MSAIEGLGSAAGLCRNKDVWPSEGRGVRARIPRRVALPSLEVTRLPWFAMSNKHNADRHRHIPKMKCTVTNWAEYEAGLRRRSSLTMWITKEAIAA